MTAESRDLVIWRSYHAAQGAIFLAQGKFAEAMTELAEDPYNALSRHSMIIALEKSGDPEAAARERARFMAQHGTSIEEAIVRSGMAP